MSFSLNPKDKSLTNLKIGVRAQEFHEGLRDTTSAPIKDVYFRRTLLIGKAATLAMHLRELDVLHVNPESLQCVALSLGIGGVELPAVSHSASLYRRFGKRRIYSDNCARLEGSQC